MRSINTFSQEYFKPSIEVCIEDYLFKDNKEWAYWIAKTLYNKYHYIGSDFEEFEQTAYEALLNCIKSFDVKKGNAFRTFTEYRIKGAILNMLPSSNEKAASYKAKSLHLNDCTDPHEEKPASSLIEIIQNMAVDYMLSENSNEEENDYSDGFSSPEYYALVASIKCLVNKLSPPKDKVIILYYFKGKSMSKIGEMLNLTKGRVSQLHRLAIKELSLAVQF